MYLGQLIKHMPRSVVINARVSIAKELETAKAELARLTSEGLKNNSDYREVKNEVSRLQNLQVSLLFRATDFLDTPTPLTSKK